MYPFSDLKLSIMEAILKSQIHFIRFIIKLNPFCCCCFVFLCFEALDLRLLKYHLAHFQNSQFYSENVYFKFDKTLKS